ARRHRSSPGRPSTSTAEDTSVRNASRRSINKAQRRQQYGDDASGTAELRAVADRIMETGARYLERRRDFLTTRRDDMARQHDWNDDRDARAHRAARMSREQAEPGDFGPRSWDDRAYGWAH